ncbi:MAG: isoprenylcysteine carboxylmethyltransferase family protein [Planctomycetota bacterium]
MKLAPRHAAVLMAVSCHGAFVAAVASMVWSLATGMQVGCGTVPRAVAPFVNALLVLQFPLLHSFLLGARGRPLLARLSPVGHGKALAVSTFALLASLQLLLAFWAWTPSGVVWHRPHGPTGVLQWVAFGTAWLFLQKALFDAGLGLQTGFAGWWALLRGRAVRLPELPTGGLFRLCRQPIYLGFALVLWTAPVWSLDWLALACGWSVYCVLGPRWKEARWLQWYGARFAAWRATVPYLLPLPRPRR